MRVVAVILVVLIGVVGQAGAQPGNTPPPPPSGYGPPPAPPPVTGPVAGEKSEGTALVLSLGGTAASIGIMAMGASQNNDELGTLGGIGIWVAPTFGHWYAGKIWSSGLTMRFAGAGAVVIGAVMLLADCFESECDEAPGVILVYGGAAAFAGGVLWDIATASSAARKYNERLRVRASYGWAVAPTITRDHAGLVLGGRF